LWGTFSPGLAPRIICSSMNTANQEVLGIRDMAWGLNRTAVQGCWDLHTYNRETHSNVHWSTVLMVNTEKQLPTRMKNELNSRDNCSES
jgi:hypothetical protein